MAADFVITKHAVERYLQRVGGEARTARHTLARGVREAAQLREKTRSGELIRVHPQLKTVFIVKPEAGRQWVVTVLSLEEQAEREARARAEIEEAARLLPPGPRIASRVAAPARPDAAPPDPREVEVRQLQAALAKYKVKARNMALEALRLTAELRGFRRAERRAAGLPEVSDETRRTHAWTAADGEEHEVERERDGTLAYYAAAPVDGLSRWAQRAMPGDEVLAELLSLAERLERAEERAEKAEAWIRQHDCRAPEGGPQCQICGKPASCYGAYEGNPPASGPDGAGSGESEMGDPRRFNLLADLIDREFPRREAQIADVAAGKGHLKAALYLRGYRRVTCWDRRRRMAKARPGQRFQLFDYRNAPRGYHLVLGMHPDEASDHIILYAAKHRVPFVLCPCCIKPSGAAYDGEHCFSAWWQHLRELAHRNRLEVVEIELPMEGRNAVLVGRPRGSRP